MVGDDLEADIAGAQALRAADDARPHRQVPAGRRRARRVKPDAILDSLGDVPAWLERRTVKVGVDLIEIERIGARSSATRASRALLHGGRARVLRLAGTPRSTTRRASPGKRRSARRSAAACASPGGRSRSSGGRSRACSSPGGRRPGRRRSRAGEIDLSMSHSKGARNRGLPGRRPGCLSRSTPRPRCARPRSATRARSSELMERAGQAVARACARGLRRRALVHGRLRRRLERRRRPGRRARPRGGGAGGARRRREAARTRRRTSAIPT